MKLPIIQKLGLRKPIVTKGLAPLVASAHPISIFGSKLIEWWTTDYLDKISLSGAAVTSWAGVLRGLAVAQAVSASRPQLSATAFGGVPGVVLNGADQFLESTDAALLALLPIGAAAGEIWAIVDQQATIDDTSTDIIAGYGGDTSPVRRGIGRAVLSGESRLQIVAGNGTTTPSGNSAAGTEFIGRHLVRGRISGTQITAYIDGVAGGAAGSVPATAANRLRLGCISNTTPANYFKGVIRDIFFLNADPTASEVAAAEAWGLPRRMI